jgi:hypothetical protein
VVGVGFKGWVGLLKLNYSAKLHTKWFIVLVGCQAASCKVYVNCTGKCILCGENTLHWTTEYCLTGSAH